MRVASSSEFAPFVREGAGDRYSDSMEIGQLLGLEQLTWTMLIFGILAALAQAGSMQLWAGWAAAAASAADSRYRTRAGPCDEQACVCVRHGDQ